MLLKKSASLAQRHLKAMTEFSNSHTLTKAASKHDFIGSTQSLATRRSLTMETVEFALNFASRQVDLLFDRAKWTSQNFNKRTQYLWQLSDCSLLGYLLKAIDEQKKNERDGVWKLYRVIYFRKLILILIDDSMTNSYYARQLRI